MPDEIKITIDAASVKVMRSFDYCHFEVCLSATIDREQQNPSQIVDDLRKNAARLADKAVAQYKIAKANAAKLESEQYDRQYEVRRFAQIRTIAEGDRTVAQQAELKAFDDANWAASRQYDYEDDWNND
jgi:hypothetical protein